MGLPNATVGFATGIVFFVMPQVLAAQHVPEAKIATITAVAMSANFWSVLFGPILDVRFSRRWHATFFAAMASLLVFIAVENLHRLLVLELVLTLAVATAGLSTAALGGWLATICPPDELNQLSAWANIPLICGVGVASFAGGELIHHLPLSIAAGLLSTSLLLPTSIFLIMPAPGPDRRLASESFMQFNREVLALLRRREVLIALLFFVSPCSSFALTNILGGLGADFHASPRIISLAGGAGAFLPGIAGCLIFPAIAKRLPLRLFYLVNGVVGGLFTLCIVVLPHQPWSFALALLGEFLFQTAAYCIQYGIMLETIGQNNPLAATTFTFLSAATNIPVTYMMIADGRGYALAGVKGSLAMDAGIGIVACILLGLLMTRIRGGGFGARVKTIETLDALAQED